MIDRIKATLPDAELSLWAMEGFEVEGGWESSPSACVLMCVYSGEGTKQTELWHKVLPTSKNVPLVTIRVVAQPIQKSKQHSLVQYLKSYSEEEAEWAMEIDFYLGCAINGT